MDGADLMAVLEERIDFVTLLLRKNRHAAQTGEIYLPIHNGSVAWDLVEFIELISSNRSSCG
jgi:hypothetical protein